MTSQSSNPLNYTQKRVLLDRMMQGTYPPHLTICFIFHKILGWSAEQIVAEFYQASLSKMALELEIGLLKAGIEKSRNSNLLRPLRQLLKKPLNVVNTGQFKRRYPNLQTCIAGDTVLSDYFKRDPVQTIESLWNTEAELGLIADCIQNLPGAFEELYQTAEWVVKGFIRVYVFDDKRAEAIAYETMLQVWQKFSDYNPAFSHFIVFAKFRAHIVIRHEIWRNRPPAHTEPFDENFPDPDEQYPDIGDLDDPLTEDEWLKTFSQMWECTFTANILPHKLIVFSFNKLLDEKPKSIVASKSDHSLNQLTRQLEVALIDRSRLPKPFIRDQLTQLKLNLEKQSFADFPMHGSSAKVLPDLGEGGIGDSLLKDYYTLEQWESNIPMWSQAVARLVGKRFLKGCGRQSDK